MGILGSTCCDNQKGHRRRFFFFFFVLSTDLEAHDCSPQICDSLVILIFWELSVEDFWLFNIAFSRYSHTSLRVHFCCLLQNLMGKEIGSTRWRGTLVTVGHKIERDPLERKKRKTVIRNQTTCAHSYIGYSNSVSVVTKKDP